MKKLKQIIGNISDWAKSFFVPKELREVRRISKRVIQLECKHPYPEAELEDIVEVENKGILWRFHLPHDEKCSETDRSGNEGDKRPQREV